MTVGTEEVAALLASHAQTAGPRPAVIHAGEVAGISCLLTFEELHRQTLGIAAQLGDRYRPGSRIMLAHDPGVDFAPAFLGCVLARMIAVPSPLPGGYRHQQARAAAIARNAGVRAVLTGSGRLGEVAAWAREHGLGDVEVHGSDRWALTGGDARTAGLPPGRQGTGPGAVVLLQYTSGSTSEPKGVMVTIGNLFANLHAQTRMLGTRSTEVSRGGWIPHYHDMGLIGHLLPGLLYGTGYVGLSATAFLKRPVRWLQVIGEFGIGLSAGPDFSYDRCLHRLTDQQIEGLDLRRWEFACNGSEPVHSSTMRRFSTRLAPAGFRSAAFVPCYGLAESTLMVTGVAGRDPVSLRVGAGEFERGHLVPDPAGRELTSSGRPGDDDTLLIVDPVTRQVLPPDQVGEVWVRGPSVAAGYWRAGGADGPFGVHTAGGQGPCLRTGDLGALRNGELYLTGRLKEVILLRGRTLYPHDIEHELRLQHPELAGGAGAVFTVPADGATARPAPGGAGEAVIVTHEVDGSRDPEVLARLAVTIRTTVSREFGVHAAGVVLLRPHTALRTTSGKIRRSAMRTEFLAGALPALAERLDAPLPSQTSLVTTVGGRP